MGISIRADEKETYLFLNGISVKKPIILRENVEILPAECKVDESSILHLLPTAGDFGVALIFLWLIRSQLHIIGDDPKTLSTRAWNSQWDGLLLGALFDCEGICNFQSNKPLGELTEESKLTVTNRWLRGLSNKIYVITEEDEKWIKENYLKAWLLLDNGKFSNAIHSLSTYRWHSLPTPQLALLWSGIEGLFDISSELVFRLSILISRFLEPNDPIRRREIYLETKHLYNLRSKLIHGSKTTKTEEKNIADTANLLRRLVFRCIKLNSIPDENDLLP